jgi:hypothetical protein
MNLGTTTLRRLGAAAALALAATALTACGGPSDAPEDASTDDFCTAVVEFPRAEEGEDAPSQDAVDGYVDGLEETGTPEDMPDDARKGWEAWVDMMNEIDVDDSEEDLEKEVEELADDDDVKAFQEYVGTTCSAAGLE